MYKNPISISEELLEILRVVDNPIAEILSSVSSKDSMFTHYNLMDIDYLSLDNGDNDMRWSFQSKDSRRSAGYDNYWTKNRDSEFIYKCVKMLFKKDMPGDVINDFLEKYFIAAMNIKKCTFHIKKNPPKVMFKDWHKDLSFFKNNNARFIYLENNGSVEAVSVLWRDGVKTSKGKEILLSERVFYRKGRFLEKMLSFFEESGITTKFNNDYISSNLFSTPSGDTETLALTKTFEIQDDMPRMDVFKYTSEDGVSLTNISDHGNKR
jgi:hypothetical protein